MNLYHLTLQKQTSVCRTLSGSFSGGPGSELVLAKVGLL
jgi:hypothetical protein